MSRLGAVSEGGLVDSTKFFFVNPADNLPHYVLEDARVEGVLHLVSAFMREACASWTSSSSTRPTGTATFGRATACTSEASESSRRSTKSTQMARAPPALHHAHLLTRPSRDLL